MSDTHYTRIESDLKFETIEGRLDAKIEAVERRLENKLDNVLSELKLNREETRHEIALLRADFSWMRWILLATVIAGMLMPMWTHYVESWLR